MVRRDDGRFILWGRMGARGSEHPGGGDKSMIMAAEGHHGGEASATKCGNETASTVMRLDCDSIRSVQMKCRTEGQ